ncbi:MAG: phosphatase PAP2 family protein [Planctomycetaceae bacterium]
MDTTVVRGDIGPPPGHDRATRDVVFEPTAGGPASAIGSRMRAHRPVLAGLSVWVVGFLVMAAVIVGLGLLLTHVLLPDGVARLDASVSQWFVRQRTATFDSVTVIGSDLGSTGGILGVAAVAALVLAIGKRWRQIGFLACALSLEFTVFLTATLLVDRHRPAVPRLDATPVTSSYPSGHAAAALTLYVGLALVVWSLTRPGAIRTVVWIVAIALPVFVGLSRLYRGMHHLTDVLASVLLGVGALSFALLATRSAVAVSEERHPEPIGPPAAASSAEVAS